MIVVLFFDVLMGQWYTDAVFTAKQENIVSGKKDSNGNLTGMYAPSSPVTRFEASKMITNAFAFAEDTSGAPHFPDVSTSDWAYSFVETLFNAGVVKGNPDGTFRGNNFINRAEMAVMIDRAMGGSVSTGFTLESASASATNKAELIFSMDVDTTTAEVMGNYTITDSSGSALSVTGAMVTAPDTVELTTGTQTAGTTYHVVAKNIKSDAGEMMTSMDGVDFLGYGADVTGGALNVSLSTQTPVAGSVPSGATGVVFTCWDFKAGAEAAMLKTLHVHRVGPGNNADFDNVYLYRGDERLTTGRTINSENQMIEFNNINQTIAPNENAKFCVVADLVAGATGGVHAFELGSAADVMTNSSDMKGSFPLRGADQLITTGVVGTVTVRKNGSLPELTVGQKGARVAQFELEANGQEDLMLQRAALYIRGSVDVSNLKNLRLFTEGNTTALASTEEVGQKDLATFSLTTPFKIGRGQRKIFYVLADLSPGRNNDNIKVYFDEPTDLLVKGATYGYGAKVVLSTTGSYDGGDSDNTAGNAGDRYSYATIKGSAFNVSFKGPAAGQVALGQKGAHGLDLEITNGSGEDVEIKDWLVNIALQNTIAGGNPDNKGLLDGTTHNLTLIKLARLNDDGSLGGSLLGPSEYLSTATDTSADVKLTGSATIKAGETVKAAVVFDLASTAAAGDKWKFKLYNLATTTDAVRDLNGDSLDGNSITPASDIVGNIMTSSQSGLTVSIANTPTTGSVSRGSNDVPLAGFTFQAGSSLDINPTSITLTGLVDGNGDGTFVAGQDAVGSTVKLSDIVDSNVALYIGNTRISDYKNINSINGTVTFNKLWDPSDVSSMTKPLVITKGQSKTILLKAHISNQTPFSGASDVIKFKIGSGDDILALDQNSQTVASGAINVTAALNGDTANSGVRITVIANGTGTVATTTSASRAALAGAANLEVGRWTFTSVNENAMLKDLQFGVLNNADSSIQQVMLYSGTNCSTQVGADSYNVTAINGLTGIINVSDLGLTLTKDQTITLCAKVLTGTVNQDGVTPPLSGSNVGLALLNVTEVDSGSGANVAAVYAGAADIDTVTGGTQAATLSTALDAESDPVIARSQVGNIGVQQGDVLQVDDEMMLVDTTVAPGNNATINPSVVRGFAGTVATTHNAGASVTRSTVAKKVTTPAAAEGAEVPTLKVGDVYYVPTVAHAAEYCLVTAITADPSDDNNVVFDTYTVEGVFGTTTVSCDAVTASTVYTAFQLHGPLSKLYRSVPEVTKATASQAFIYGDDTLMLDLNVKAKGDQVRFNSAGANQVQVTLKSNVNLGAAASCRLVDATNQKTLDTADTAGGATSETLTFDFSTSGLTIDADQTINLQVRCNSLALLGNNFSSSVTASLQSATTVVQWNDTVGDVSGAGDLIVTNQLTGNTAATN